MGRPPETISGGGVSRVFQVDTGAQVALVNLTITGGAAVDGGGIFNDGHADGHQLHPLRQLRRQRRRRHLQRRAR